MHHFDHEKGIECYADVDCDGAWSIDTIDCASSVLSRTLYDIQVANCPIFWVSNMQTEIALSST